MEKEIVIGNDLSEVVQVSLFIKDLSMSLLLPTSVSIKLGLAVEEAITGIIYHAYPNRKKGNIKIKASYINGDLNFLIVNDGISLDPTLPQEETPTLTIKELLTRDPSFFLIRRTMDEVTYHSVDQSNYMMLMKKLNETEDPSGTLSTNICKIDDTLIFTIEGRLDTANARDFEAIIEPLIDSTVPHIIVNCKELSFISSSGLRCFILLQKNIIRHHRTLVIEDMRPEIRKIFDMTGCSSVFTIQ